MASRWESRRNNVIAGVFVVCAIALAVAISIMVGGVAQRLTPSHRYIVRFELSDGAPGLRPGSEVTLGGQPVGRILEVRFASVDADGRSVARAVDVHIAVQRDILLYEDAWAFLERPLLGAVAKLNIAHVGEGAVERHRGRGPELEPGEVLPGRLAPPAFLAQAGFGPDQARRLREMITRGNEIVDRIGRITGRVEEELEPDLESIRGALEDVKALTGDLRGRVPEWTDRVDSVLARIDETAADVQTGVSETRTLIADVSAALSENRPHVDSILASAESAAMVLDRESIPLLNETLRAGSEAVDRFNELSRDGAALLAEFSPSLRRFVSNLRLAADQFRLTSVEVRRNPWRLLHRPGTRELETELFYDAARAYADAVSDLRVVSEAIEAAARADPGAPWTRQTLDEMAARLTEAFERYQQTERLLLERMIGQQGR